MTDPDQELEKLLKEQDDFFRSGKPAAATVTRTRAPPIGAKGQTASRFARQRQQRVVEEPSLAQPRLPVLNPNAAVPPPQRPPFEPPAQPSPRPPVVTEIREREAVVGAPLPLAPLSRARDACPRAFPRAVHRSELSADESSRLRVATGRRSARRDDGALASATGGTVSGGANGAAMSQRGAQAVGAKEAAAIHSENVSRIEAMGGDEIRALQARPRLGPRLESRAHVSQP